MCYAVRDEGLAYRPDKAKNYFRGENSFSPSWLPYHLLGQSVKMPMSHE